MTASATHTATTPSIRELAALTDGELLAVCRRERVQVERNASGNIILMAPTGADSGNRNFNLYPQFYLWNQRAKAGRFFDSNTMLRLSNGAIRIADVAFVTEARWLALAEEERLGIANLTPDFVVELRSPSDAITDLQDKLREYISCGVRLGWLIDPYEHRVWVYRPGREPELIADPTSLVGEDVLPGLVVDLTEIMA